MIRINDILDKITDYDPEADTGLVERAYIYSARVHDGQVRLSGEPYLSHPLEVAGILADMSLDPISIAAGLLHDVIEDTHATPDEISGIFGTEVVHIVSGVTKLSAVTFDSSQARQAESIRKMLLAMADDIRVILIKLADRIHNMRTLQFHKSEKKKKEIAQETMDIYAPIASRLGIYWIKNELEDMSFRYLHPEQYENLKLLLSRDMIERETYIEKVKVLIRTTMSENSLKCQVLGRYKNLYSIRQKMIKQSLPFEEIYDIIAFRIVLDNVTQCYAALGLIHGLWKPIDSKIKDYIGRPKPNMYQSLHTTVIGPDGKRIEIQIRTWEMDKVAKSGIAAHWSYKEGRRIEEAVSRQFAWIQNLIENQKNIRNPNEFMENVRLDLFPDEVYVFTPRGEVKSLPKGATPVDFAYLIHTEVGNQCTGAKVNSRIVPLQYQLSTGDSIEIITTKNHTPSKDWLGFVRTVKARSKIQQWVRAQEKDRSVSLGREMCDKAFRKHRLNFNELAKSSEMDEVVAHFGFKAVDDLFASVGFGKITPLQIIRRFSVKADQEEVQESFLEKIIGKVRKKKHKSGGVIVKGMDDILVKFGKCCEPVPGDSITGYITRGFGVTVHRTNCINALTMSQERQIDVQWDEAIKETYPVKIHVKSYDRVGLLADLAMTISKSGANILSANSKIGDTAIVDSLFTLSIRNTDHLNRLLAEIRKVKAIQDVQRIDH
jgi:GTP pyrophosphokinase